MTAFGVDHPEVVEAVRRALEEDIGSGDVTSAACVPAERRATGRFIPREPMVLAGIELLPLIYRLRGGVEKVELLKSSGDSVVPGEVAAVVRGRARTLLECERVSLNFLQRLSGVATLGRRYVDAVAGTRCRILDTRKTTPGLRRLEKMAAAAGGVTNHRMGLWDAILIKNNHISAAGGVTAAFSAAEQMRAVVEAAQRVRGGAGEDRMREGATARAGVAGVGAGSGGAGASGEAESRTGLEIEIEVRTRAELEEALTAGARHLLLDNLTPAEAAEWIAFIAGRATVELSGGITLENVRAYAEAGADFVSSGAITHSAAAVDLNFRLELE